MKEDGPIVNPTESRQAVIGRGRVFKILIVSLMLTIVAGIIVYFAFFPVPETAAPLPP